MCAGSRTVSEAARTASRSAAAWSSGGVPPCSARSSRSVYRCSARAVRASGFVRHCRVASSVASGQYTGLGHPQRRFRGSLVKERIRAGRELEGRPGSRCASTGAKYRAQIEHAGRGLVVVTGRPPVSGSDGDPPSGLVTLLFTNIEGSTRLLRRVGDHYKDLLERHRQIIRDASVAEGGFEIGHEGDSVRIVFQTASDGITAALAAQRALHDESWPTGCAVRVRMGLHTGPVDYASGQYAGITVHDAARVANAARGGQIVCSETTADCTRHCQRERRCGRWACIASRIRPSR